VTEQTVHGKKPERLFIANILAAHKRMNGNESWGEGYSRGGRKRLAVNSHHRNVSLSPQVGCRQNKSCSQEANSPKQEHRCNKGLRPAIDERGDQAVAQKGFCSRNRGRHKAERVQYGSSGPAVNTARSAKPPGLKGP